MTLRSTSTIRVLDLLCEGPIEGFAEAIDDGKQKSILLNENPATVQGSKFEKGQVEVMQRFGTPGQTLGDEFLETKNTEVVTINEEIGENYKEDLTVQNTVSKKHYGRGNIVKKIETIPTDLSVIRINFI